MTAANKPTAPAAQRSTTRRQWLRRSGWALLGLGGAAAVSYRYWAPLLLAGDTEAPVDVCITAPPIAHDPASGLPAGVPHAAPAEARCPVCGMFPARQPAWAAQAIYQDGAVHYFDSPVNLMVFLADVPRYSRGRTLEDVQTVWVTHAKTGTWLPARQAWYVHGSDARGPMRTADLPAFPSQQEAQEFAGRRGGTVLTFDAITPAIVQSLSGTRNQAGHNHH